ncbi:E3 ubiquitin-protein ligase At1g12760-like [Silene latifolia]|uniref:E3 ubiquitin-protein ligase At1g12760-like n=1 Tax=Silene latifolia TaxID=37657 RepID=UPI003D789B62
MSTTTTTTKPLLNPANDQRHFTQHGEFTPADDFLGSLYIVLDLIWRTLILSVAVVVVVLSKDVTTTVPLRVWVIGYAALRVLHMIYACINYWRWREATKALFRPFDALNSRHTVLDRITNCLQLVKSVLNVIWWIIGAYWMFYGGQMLAYDAPKLFWFTAIFLALDLFYVSIFVCTSCIDYGAALL